MIYEINVFLCSTHVNDVKKTSKIGLFKKCLKIYQFFKFFQKRKKVFQNWQEITRNSTIIIGPGPRFCQVGQNVAGFWSSPYRKTKECPQIIHYLVSAPQNFVCQRADFGLKNEVPLRPGPKRTPKTCPAFLTTFWRFLTFFTSLNDINTRYNVAFDDTQKRLKKRCFLGTLKKGLKTSKNVDFRGFWAGFEKQKGGIRQTPIFGLFWPFFDRAHIGKLNADFRKIAFFCPFFGPPKRPQKGQFIDRRCRCSSINFPHERCCSLRWLNQQKAIMHITFM